MFFFIVGAILPVLDSDKTAFISTTICFLIELSQLSQAAWLTSLRSYRLGGLILGFGFLWSDLVCYVIGAALGLAVERLILRKN